MSHPKASHRTVLVDVKRPDYDYGKTIRLKTLNLRHALELPKAPSGRNPRVLLWGGVFGFAVVIIAVIVIGVNIRGVQAAFHARGDVIAQTFAASLSALQSFHLEEATNSFRKNEKNLRELGKLVAGDRGSTLRDVLGAVVPAFKEARALIAEVGALNANFFRLAQVLGDLQRYGFQYFQRDGARLLGVLRSAEETMGTVVTQTESIQNAGSRLTSISPSFARFSALIGKDYLQYSGEARLWKDGIASLINLLEGDKEKHVLLLFQNSSEIRPAGGFIGSYGDLVIARGGMQALEVQDIYWPDHPMNVTLKIIPPEPLQRITENWGARDANWFFDFPASAESVLRFLESSAVYRDKNISFEGVIGLNINVLQTALEFTGPITLQDYGMEIRPDNFLLELQREVEAGRDKKKGENPKRVLSALAPLVLERLEKFPPEKQELLSEKIQNHFAKKDIMVFSREGKIAHLLKEKGIDGSVAKLSTDFWGSYLAVVNANIAGGKSDAFIDQAVTARIDLDTGGSTFTDLTVERTHRGEKEKEWWWKADNKNFIQVFTTPGSRLVSLAGETARPALPEVDYPGLGYGADSQVTEIEETQIFLPDWNAWTMEAFGKRVFATWFTTPAGKTADLRLRYQTPRENSIVEAGKEYQFIFERQSGVSTKLHVEFTAPLGYLWQESGSPLFVFEKDDLFSRETLALHLTKKT